MADFCQRCSIDIFGEDFKELANLCKEGEVVSAICEGCDHDPGFCCKVNHLGQCMEFVDGQGWVKVREHTSSHYEHTDKTDST